MIYKNKYMKQYLYILFFSCVVLGCQIKTERAEGPDESSVSAAEKTAAEKMKATDPRKNERYSLTEDRSKFEELRKDIPAEMKSRNDEKALYMEWMAGYEREPSDIRSKYSALVFKKRENFNKDMNQIRDLYNKEETKKKDAFSKAIAEERNEIKDQKLSREERTEAYNKIDTKRKDFYAELREDRDSFEADYRQKRKDFEDYIKEKSDVFNAQLKEYTAKFNDLKKAKGK